MNKYLDTFKQLQLDYSIELTEDVKELIDFLEAQGESNRPTVTEAGLADLEFLQGSDKATLKSKDIADGMGVSSRKVSGSIRKLCADGFVDKFGSNPVTYSLTEKGKTFDIEYYKTTIEDKKNDE